MVRRSFLSPSGETEYTLKMLVGILMCFPLDTYLTTHFFAPVLGAFLFRIASFCIWKMRRICFFYYLWLRIICHHSIAVRGKMDQKSHTLFLVYAFVFEMASLCLYLFCSMKGVTPCLIGLCKALFVKVIKGSLFIGKKRKINYGNRNAQKHK